MTFYTSLKRKVEMTKRENNTATCQSVSHMCPISAKEMTKAECLDSQAEENDIQVYMTALVI